MLKANGFNEIDLGKNVEPEQFVEAAQAHHAVAIGMSVMTNSSVVYAQKIVELLNEDKSEGDFLLMTGGSAMNEKIATELSIKYGSDANAAVTLVRQHLADAA
jgi:methanogenic corrinoid protein MtbC1